MLVKVSFEFLGSLKNISFIYEAKTFEENGEKFIKSFRIVQEDLLLNVPEAWEDPKSLSIMEKFNDKLPPYLAQKDFRNYVQAVFPTARVEILETKDLN